MSVGIGTLVVVALVALCVGFVLGIIFVDGY